MTKYEQYRNQTEFDIPETMWAVRLAGKGFENLRFEQIPVPQVDKNQLLARVDAAGVCTSILKIIAQGADHTYINGWDLNRWPVILGDEGSVTLVKIGENLQDKYKIGQRFAIQPAVDVAPICHRERYRNNAEGMKKCAVGYTLNGNLAQYILIQEEVIEGQCLIPLPNDDLAYFAVSMAEPISCVHSAQDRQFHIYKAGPFAPRVPKLGMLKDGTTVVIGAGAMGRMHIELAMRFRPKNLIVADLIEERLERVQNSLGEKAKNLGINLITVNGNELKDTVMKVTNGSGADDIVFAVGVQAVQQAGLELLGKGGVANLFGGLPKGKNILQVDAIAVHYNEIKLVGSSGGEPSDMKAVLDAYVSNDIDPGNYVCGIGSLKHAIKVLELIQQAKVDGKVILYPHADLDELKFIDYWDKQQEIEFLNTHLR